MGYVMAWAPCYGCGQVFGFNPLRVPSLTPPGGTTREPICEHCVERANRMRRVNGVPVIVPAPDAYAPVAEEEL